jgi:anti-anti-sigma regulatory factor
MMRIQEKEAGGKLILQVHGTVSGPFVSVLESCWERASGRQDIRGVSVDLQQVTCVDRAGRRLLQSMYSSGVSFDRPGLSVKDILDQFMEQPECRQ